jgi:hypothetical protein
MFPVVALCSLAFVYGNSRCDWTKKKCDFRRLTTQNNFSQEATGENTNSGRMILTGSSQVRADISPAMMIPVKARIGDIIEKRSHGERQSGTGASRACGNVLSLSPLNRAQSRPINASTMIIKRISPIPPLG